MNNEYINKLIEDKKVELAKQLLKKGRRDQSRIFELHLQLRNLAYWKQLRSANV